MTHPKSTSKRSLLVVDDDRLVLAMLSNGLKHAGYAVTEAYSGEQALKQLEGLTPDLAVLDISMPGLSGLELAATLRDNANIPFIFLTAYGDEETVREATSCGAVGYLVKPVDTAQLIPAIEAGLARAADIAALQKSEENLSAALGSSREISLAVGIIMERARLNQDAAFQSLRAQARSSRQQVHELAKSLINAHEMLSKFEA